MGKKERSKIMKKLLLVLMLMFTVSVTYCYSEDSAAYWENYDTTVRNIKWCTEYLNKRGYEVVKSTPPSYDYYKNFTEDTLKEILKLRDREIELLEKEKKDRLKKLMEDL